MATSSHDRLRIFVDADVLFAGSASSSRHGAGLIILRMAELTLIEAVASEQVVAEAERDLAAKMPEALPAFRLLVSRCLRVVPNPVRGDLRAFHGLADPKDVPILVTATRERCAWLATFNARHYRPGHPAVTVLEPGDLVVRMRHLLSQLPNDT